MITKDKVEDNKEEVSPVENTIWGDSFSSFYFSTKGTFNRLQFFGAMATLNLFFNLVKSTQLLPVVFLGGCIVLYSLLIAMQKRCKDFNSKGTILLIIALIAFPIMQFFIYFNQILNINDIDINVVLKYVILGLACLYILVYIFLQFMPPKKEKNPNIISPIFKHPIIYFSICIVLSLIFYVVMYQMYVE